MIGRHREGDWQDEREREEGDEGRRELEGGKRLPWGGGGLRGRDKRITGLNPSSPPPLDPDF